MLTPEEKKRYERQISLPEIGESGQEKLKRAKVVIAGAGGLGSPACIYLTAAGVGTIRIIDNDKVEMSNLNRQVLHWERDVGRSKVASATEKLGQVNHNVTIEAVEETINEDNVSQLTAGFDVIIDALDNLPTRYLLNRASVEARIPLIHGAIYGFEGRAMTVIPGETACLMCVYRGSNPGGKPPIIGVAPAVIGAIEATEAIKYITGAGKLLTNRLLTYDGLNMKFSELTVKRDPDCRHCGHRTG